MAKQISIEEYQARLKALAEAAKERAAQVIVIPAANKLLAKKKNTIQVSGQKTDGSQIGQYSTKPMYATANQFVKTGSFKPRGKSETGVGTTSSVDGIPGASTTSYKDKIKKAKVGGKNVAVRKVQGFNAEVRESMYLPQGYKQLREIQGRPVDKVNLTYTGDLLAAYQLQATPTGAVIGLTNERAAMIREGLENGTKKRKGYGKIFYAQQVEIDAYNKEVTEAARKFTLNILNGNA